MVLSAAKILRFGETDGKDEIILLLLITLFMHLVDN